MTTITFLKGSAISRSFDDRNRLKHISGVEPKYILVIHRHHGDVDGTVNLELCCTYISVTLFFNMKCSHDARKAYNTVVIVF